jgi:hypothetical protein
MPGWVLLVEYLPLFALLIIGYIFKLYNRRQRPSNVEFSRKTEQMARV